MDEKEKIIRIIEQSIETKKAFMEDEPAVSNVAAAVESIKKCYGRDGKLIVFGNGGSASDSQHMAAEMVVRFRKERKALGSISLASDTSILTAASNDYDFSRVFVRQLEALLKDEDVVFAISTSGASPNVIEAVRYARKRKVTVIALTGKSGGELAAMADIPIIVRSDVTARIQETHGAIIHAICELVEEGL